MGDKFKALADDNRRKILKILSEGDRASGEVAKKFKSFTEPSLPVIDKWEEQYHTVKAELEAFSKYKWEESYLFESRTKRPDLHQI